MDAFTTHTGTALPLRRSNVDTDQIIPAEYLKRITRSGFEDALFASWRGDPDFVLNAGGIINIAAEIRALAEGGAYDPDWVELKLERMTVTLDFSKLMQLLSEAFAMLGGTPTPGGVEPTPMPPLNVNINITISKQNDSSITIPSP